MCWRWPAAVELLFCGQPSQKLAAELTLTVKPLKRASAEAVFAVAVVLFASFVVMIVFDVVDVVAVAVTVVAVARLVDAALVVAVAVSLGSPQFPSVPPTSSLPPGSFTVAEPAYFAVVVVDAAAEASSV